MTLNRYECIGNLGRDPAVKAFQSGDRVASFSVGTTESWKDKQTGERKQHTEWSDWSVRGGLVDVAEKYLRKGSKVFLAGKKRTRKYTDRDGMERTAVEFIATDLTMLDGKPDGQREGKRPAAGDEGYIDGFDPPRGGGGGFGTAGDDLDDDVPFATASVRFEGRVS